MNDQQLKAVAELNRHPLNQAALARLRAERAVEEPHRIHLLSLAFAGLVDAEGESPDPHSPELQTLETASQTVATQRGALRHLADELTPENLQADPLPELAEAVWRSLHNLGSQGSDR